MLVVFACEDIGNGYGLLFAIDVEDPIDIDIMLPDTTAGVPALAAGAGATCPCITVTPPAPLVTVGLMDVI